MWHTLETFNGLAYHALCGISYFALLRKLIWFSSIIQITVILSTCFSVWPSTSTHLLSVPHICVNDLGQHWFKRLVACSELSNYLNQCWLIVNWTRKKNFSEIWIKIQNFHSWKCIWKCLPHCGSIYPEGLKKSSSIVIYFMCYFAFVLVLQSLPDASIIHLITKPFQFDIATQWQKYAT